MKVYIQRAAITAVLILAVIGAVFVGVFLAMQFGLFNVRGSIAERNAFFGTESSAPKAPCVDAQYKVCDWNQTPEWEVVKGGLQKDAAVLARVSQETGVSARMIATVVVPEQTRFFVSNREVFKRYFEPLKILGSLSQFSLGVSGIKEGTAQKIEQYANEPGSMFYPGEGMSELVAYDEGITQNSELFNRLTDAKDHYYSLLYTALYIKEIQEQWKRAGFDISKNPGAVATLFNVGFQASNPNANPRAAGAIIETGGHSYSYGELGALFYNSDELTEIFPK